MFIFRKARSEKRKASCKKWPHSNRKTVVTPSSQVVHTKEKYHFVTSKYQAVSWNFMKSYLIVFKELILRNKRLKSLRFPSTWIFLQKSRKNSLFQVKLIKTAVEKFHKNLNSPKILNYCFNVYLFKKVKKKKPAQIIRQEWKLLQFFLLQIAAECCQSFLALNSQGFVVNVGTSQQRLRLLERVPSQTHT